MHRPCAARRVRCVGLNRGVLALARRPTAKAEEEEEDGGHAACKPRGWRSVLIWTTARVSGYAALRRAPRRTHVNADPELRVQDESLAYPDLWKRRSRDAYRPRLLCSVIKDCMKSSSALQQVQTITASSQPSSTV